MTGGGGYRQRDEGYRQRDEGNWRSPAGRNRGNSGASRWDQTINYTGRGQGRFFRPGEGRRRISAVVVRIERNGRVLTDLNTDRGRVSFTGRVVRVLDNDRIAALMRSGDGGIEGEMLLWVSGDRVRDISMDAGSGRDRVELNWSED